MPSRSSLRGERYIRAVTTEPTDPLGDVERFAIDDTAEYLGNLRTGARPRTLADGTKVWVLRGVLRPELLHRDDGPAIESPDGKRQWFRYGRRHREDGPAVESRDGTSEWWLDGARIDPPS